MIFPKLLEKHFESITNDPIDIRDQVESFFCQEKKLDVNKAIAIILDEHDTTSYLFPDSTSYCPKIFAHSFYFDTTCCMDTTSYTDLVLF